MRITGTGGSAPPPRRTPTPALPGPPPGDGDQWNGVPGAPTRANIAAAPDLELVVATASAGMVAYDLPGSANARVLGAPGRGSFLRPGAQPPQSSFTMSAAS